ncbi:DUF427 domain-containing protein [Paucibacter sp. M5-1]|uniref:DUF427 domain-containing protein n=1 Tax=Paucibacter sp. M5-1 TaxID=3015998 RepID=UPI003F807055
MARTRGAWAVREATHPPSCYLPLADVHRGLLRPAGGGSFCEWKGPARYWDLVNGSDRLLGHHPTDGKACGHIAPPIIRHARSLAAWRCALPPSQGQHVLAFVAGAAYCAHLEGKQQFPADDSDARLWSADEPAPGYRRAVMDVPGGAAVHAVQSGSGPSARTLAC